MSNPRTLIPSPARSQGAPRTPRRYVTPRKTTGVGSPARSASGRLSTLVQEDRDQAQNSSVLSPIVGRSLLPDDTDIVVPGRKSWWKNLNDQSRDVTEVMKENFIEPHNIMDELNVEVLSQEEKKHYTLDIPDSSDCESIHSIVISRKTLFNQKENRPQKQYDDFGNRGTLEKVFQPNASSEKPTSTHTKKIFQNKPTAKPVFPAALLDVSANTTVSDKTLAPAIKPKSGLRNMFGTQQATKRKNMFAKFIESTTDYSSEEEIADVSKIQRKFFDLPKPVPQRRTSARSSSSKFRDPSSTSNDMADSFADWDHLPSSTMVENQLEAALTGGNKAKKSRLSKLSEASSPLTSNSSKSKQSKKSLKNMSQIKDKSLNEIVDIPQNISLTLKSEEAKRKNTSETSVNLKHTQNKVQDDSININNDSKTIMNKEKDVTKIIVMDVDEKQTEEQEFMEMTDDNTTKQTQNKNQTKILDKSIRNNEEQVKICSENNVIDKAMEKLDKIINQDVDMYVHVSQDASIYKSMEKNLECANENFTIVTNKEHDSENKRNEINENSNICEKDNVIEKDNDIYKTQTENKQNNSQIVNVETVVENEIAKSQTESKSVIENETEKVNSQEETKVGEENITEEQIESAIDNQDKLCDNCDQEGKNESDTEEQGVDKNDSIIERQTAEENESDTKEQEVNKNESKIEEQAADENDSEIEEQEVEENVSEIEEQEMEENESEIEEQEVDENESEISEQEAGENESEIEKQVDENEVEDENQDNEDNNQDVTAGSEVGEQEMTPEASDQSMEAMVDSEPENDQESEQEQEVNESDHESDNEEEVVNESDNEQINESDNEQINESDNEQINESDRESEAEQESDQEKENDQNDDDEIDNTLTPDISHDTTGRNRKKPDNVSIEAVVFRPTKELEHSFVGRARNTSVRKSKSLINPQIEPENIQENNTRGSLSMSDGKNSSAEGSGWDSHRTTRKTLRQTFGKDFTPRKSLRALVMEKSAKRHTLVKGKDINTGNIPLANSTEFGEASMGDDYERQEESLELVHEVSIRTRKADLEECLRKIKQESVKKRAEIAEAVTKQLEQPPKEHIFKLPGRPTFQHRTQTKGKPKVANKKLKLSVPLEDLPLDVQEDLKYKPPKRFAPRNAAWLTKRFYRYVESKLEAKYDYKARVRAEKFAQMLHKFVQVNKKRNVALSEHVEALKHEMARLKIVKTHFEFYNFFWDFMPKEVCLKVIPDLTNKIPQPPTGIFSDIF